jgi:hypothetical protein
MQVHAQELFPSNEPASTMPKGVIGLRFLYETYKELPSQRIRYWDALRLMYGITSNMTVMLTGSASNHHPKAFPSNLQNYFINHHQRFFPANPFLFEGLNLYVKYRIVNVDERQKHIRVAAIGEVCKSFVPHDEAEPNLMGDNSGAGGGLIGTILYKRFVVSFTGEAVRPFPYNDKKQNITFKAGNAWIYNLSFGYRIFPREYKTYKDLNVNLYVEFINKHYEKAVMTQDGKPFDFDIFQYFDLVIYNSLQENKYSEVRSSVQLIFNSNNRIDIGIAQPFIGKSYLHFYPMFFFSLQKYFYPGSKKIS